MNSISFKAKLAGYSDKITEREFEIITRQDKQHKIVFTDFKNTNGNDIFLLQKKNSIGEYSTTAVYAPEFIEAKDSKYTLTQLLKIFDTMKIIEARNLVKIKIQNKHKKNDIKEYNSLLHEIMREELSQNMKK